MSNEKNIFIIKLFVAHRPENIHTYNETARISFYFVVMDPTKPDTVIPKAEVEAAIWYFLKPYYIKI